MKNNLTALELSFDAIPEKDRAIVVGRLITSFYHNSDGIYSRREFRFLKRQCQSFNFLKEDADAIGADEAWRRIINIDDCKDGIYQVITCNESRDYETGIIDDYDFKLVPA
jgi:hypothetical protein